MQPLRNRLRALSDEQRTRYETLLDSFERRWNTGPADPPDGTIFVSSNAGGLRTVHLTSSGLTDLGGIDPGYVYNVSSTGGMLFLVNSPTVTGRAECYTLANPAANVGSTKSERARPTTSSMGLSTSWANRRLL